MSALLPEKNLNVSNLTISTRELILLKYKIIGATTQRVRELCCADPHSLPPHTHTHTDTGFHEFLHHYTPRCVHNFIYMNIVFLSTPLSTQLHYRGDDAPFLITPSHCL